MSHDDYAESFTHVLRTRCGGLLELTESTGEVNYIHRTAREYIQKPKTWEILLTHTSNLKFNPWFTWSIVNLQELKAFTNRDPFFWMWEITSNNLWKAFTVYVHHIASSKVKDHILELVEEFNRVAQRYLKFHRPSTNQLKHWYESNYKDTPIDHTNVNYTTFAESCPDQDVSKGDRADLWSTMNLLLACVEDTVSPYVEMKIISDPSLMQLEYDPPLVAIYFGNLILGYDSSYPRLRLLVFLLENNANFNEIYHGHSLWRIFLHVVHTKLITLEYHEDLNHIFRAMEIMLQRGADVEACCIEKRTIWYKMFPNHGRYRTGRYDGLEQHCKRPLSCKDVFDIGSSDSSDDSASHISENYNEPWEVRHSLERIIKDIFETYCPDLVAKLLSLVAKKKAEKLAIEKQSRDQKPGSSGGNRGRKQKQRNRKKGKGKRGQIALRDDSDYRKARKTGVF
ncbi:hypothetical protein BPAE_0073g00090 [Botrytis paeoniae]|uniref:DUF7791 domain-containing protein n=1 Tax=Botrytis paeoniae TaxID=278948 RepID=A0A4Z1FU46_9HELO|nr:hypothetical protein BPAE_0073g00090 [Botrytis paeoniae]